MHQTKHTSSAGFGLVELILAVALFSIVMMVGVTLVIHTFSVNRLSEEETRAALLAQEGIAVTRSLKNQDWASVAPGIYGLQLTGNTWSLVKTPDVTGPFTRTVSISTATRDVSGNLVSSGVTDDSDVLRVTSTIGWQFSPTRNNTVSVMTYLSNFRKNIGSTWASLVFAGGIDLSGNIDGRKLQVQGNYAYVVRPGGSPEFAIVDISNPAAPTLTGSITTLSGSPNNIFVLGNYAYIASNANNQELQIINITNPASPTLAGTFNATGNHDGQGVYVVGTTAYLTRSTGTPNFHILNVSNPAAVSQVGSLSTGQIEYEVVVDGNYAYLASANNSRELTVINVTTPALPVISGTGYNFSGNTDALTLSKAGNTVFLGIGTSVVSVSVSNPLAPTLQGSVNLSGTVQDLSINLALSNTRLFAATSNTAAEVRMINVTNPASMSITASVNQSGNHISYGVAYDSTLDRVAASSSSNAQELMVITSP